MNNPHFSDRDEVLYALKQVYKNLVKSKQKKYGWEGPLLESDSILCTSNNLDERFTEESIQFLTDYKKQDILDIIFSPAIDLGIQQGIFLCSKDPTSYLETENWPEEHWIALKFIK